MSAKRDPRLVPAGELLQIYRRRRDMRARGTIAYSQELFDDIVSLAAHLETLPAEELCSLEEITGADGITLIIRADRAQIGRLRVSHADKSE